MSLPRPKIFTEEMKLAAARKTVALLVAECKLTEAETEQSVLDVAKCGSVRFDGYALAKALDERGWDCDLQMADTLDTYGDYVRKEMDAAELQWATMTNPQPPFPPGTHVRFGGESGIIDTIDNRRTAKYLIKVDGDSHALEPMNARRVVNFEDVTEFVAAAA